MPQIEHEPFHFWMRLKTLIFMPEKRIQDSLASAVCLILRHCCPLYVLDISLRSSQIRARRVPVTLFNCFVFLRPCG